jgi:hypothetical protein
LQRRRTFGRELSPNTLTYQAHASSSHEVVGSQFTPITGTRCPSWVGVRLFPDGKTLLGVVTGHDSKDGKPIFEYQYDHGMPDGSVVKADKWAWLEQLVDMTF